MLNDLTKTPPTLQEIQDKRHYKRRVEKVALSASILTSAATIATIASMGWNPFLLLGGFALASAAAGLYTRLRKNKDLDNMPSRFNTYMKVFAKASSPSAHYYLHVTYQERPFVMAEFKMLEREFKRASRMREQDLKSGNKRMFPPLTASHSTKVLALDTHHGEASKQFATSLPACD